jgi:tritrans,polycis-undecaprenyl-diphosphate synthase [geranylgeranyl-diphosphate specific]
MELTSVGIIPDGNRRYAEEHNLSLIQAYSLGTAKAWDFIDWLSSYKAIKFGTFYTLSLDNLARSRLELTALMRIFDKQLDKVFTNPVFEEKGIRLKFIGRISELPSSLRKKIADAERHTAGFSEKVVQLALGYSGRAEIVDAARSFALACSEGRAKPEDMNEESFRSFLYSDVKDPDLVIRTSGTKRLSGFLTYQSAYSELYFS